MASTPNIRFQRFTGDWEEKKLEELADLLTGYPFESKQFTREGIPLIRGLNVKRGYLDMSSVFCEHWATADGLENYILCANDIVIQMDGALIGRSYALINIENTPSLLVQRVTRVRCEKCDSGYVYQCIERGFLQYIKGLKTETAVPHLSLNDIKKFEIPIPESKQEQNEISTFFRYLDHLITFHQHKCDETKKLKKYMLQKMFPQNGKKIPEIRFAGFTDDWKQCKVTELGEIYIGLVTTMTSHYTNQGTLLVRNSDIKDSRFEFGDNPIYLDDEFATENASRKHRVGDVITVHTGDIGTSAVITENEAGSIGFATIVTRPYKNKIISKYLCTYLNTDTHKKFAIGISTGDGRNNYNLKDYYECVVPVPDLEEQKKISECIQNLNNLITFHQRNCDTLKEVKKFMLQNMFPTAN